MKKLSLLSAIIVLLLSGTSGVSYAQAGSLDGTFGAGGIVSTSFGSITVFRGSVAIQSDGKIVMAGTLNNGSNGIITLARYNTDGSLDNTFDGDGKLTTLIGPNCEASAVVIQADGKIVVAGNADDITTRSHFAVVRYNTDGSLDNTFDVDGIATPTFPASNDELANCLALQADGKIVVAGVSYTLTGQDFAIARYNINGSLDNTFDGDGLLATAIGSSDDMVYSIALQTDGKIVAAGNSDIGGNMDFALARYNTNGSLDNTFDGDGKLTTSIGFAQNAAGLAIQTDGKILIAGSDGSNFVAARYNTDGSLDNTFDGDGKVITPVGTSNSAEANSIDIQPDGKIIVAGFAFVSTGRDFALVRYNTNGSLDNTFDGDGKVTTNINGNDFGNSLKLSGQRIYVGGVSNTNVFALAAYQTGSVLPLHLLAFSGKKINSTIQLNWVTENEINTSLFDIERSSNGIAFTKIGEVAAINSSGKNEYTFADVHPLNGINYYRLKQTDIDGRFTYSPIIRVSINGIELLFVLSPNPATNFINITYTGKKEKVTISIYDAQGRLVKEQTQKGELIIKAAIQQLMPGIYFIQLADNDTIQQGKFIKQ
jgi:uncharacterized delta-60 repeat protein